MIKFFVEVNIPDDQQDTFKIMVQDIASVVDGSNIVFHALTPGVDFDKFLDIFGKFLYGIMHDPEFSKSVKFANNDEYELFKKIAAIVRAPLTGFKP